MIAIRKATFNPVTSRLAGQRTTYALAQSASPRASGYRLVFSDDFDTLDLSPDGNGVHKWCEGV